MDDQDQKREEVVAKFKNFFKSDNLESSDEPEQDLQKGREELIKTIKEKKDWVVYILLGVIIWFTSWFRLQNIPNLRDITTGKLVPLALDPYLFLRYAKYIVENGALFANDMSRFVPEGISTVKYVFMSSFIAYFYKVLHFFNSAVTIEYADVVYPVAAFAVALVFFFLLLRRIFDVKVALLATLFLGIVPAFLQRTMAGFSDHEALGIMFMFIAMYFYVVGWDQKKTKGTVFYGALAGLFTGLMGLTWGGWKFLLLIISLFTMIVFFFDKLEIKDYYQYFSWVGLLVLSTTTLIPMFSLKALLSSFTTGVTFLVLFMLLIDLIVMKKDLLKIKHKLQGKVPLSVASLAISFVLGLVLVSAVIGPGTLIDKSTEITDNLLHPLGNDRWELTVAEQRQPYFTDWVAQFGPMWFNIPIYLTLFMVGSILLFYNLVKKSRKNLLLTGVYVAFLLAFVMSRHSPSSIFNGVNTISIAVYLGSLALFMLFAAYYYFHSFYKNKSEYKKILKWEDKFIFVFVWFFILIVAARGAARLMFIFAPVSALMAGYAVVEFMNMAAKIKNKWSRLAVLVVLVLVVVSPFAFPAKGVIPVFAKSSMDQAKYSGPSYNGQWQRTGEWVRANVPKDAVFAHWWDYGYWVQSGFERSTILDGTNKNRYWNYLMGRNVLGAQTQEEALEFLKAHKATNVLIVSDEIGKYTAYSSIGSDANYDRFSWITTFGLNQGATQETRNSTRLMYQGSYTLDDDFVWEGKVFPAKQAGIGAVFVNIRDVGGNIVYDQPIVALVNNGQRTDLPLECLYVNKKMYKFDKPGMKGCFRILPTLDGDGKLAHGMGAGMFVSDEGLRALWTNLYVFDQNNPDYDTSAFKMVYGEDGTYAPLSLINGRLIGPQKIWEINYPEGFTISEETRQKMIGPNSLLPDYFYDVN